LGTPKLRDINMAGGNRFTHMGIVKNSYQGRTAGQSFVYQVDHSLCVGGIEGGGWFV
jgi:hypothetical protein